MKLRFRFDKAGNFVGIFRGDPIPDNLTSDFDFADATPEQEARFLSGSTFRLENGRLTETPLSDEVKAKGVRAKRNGLLAATDWTQVVDAALSDEEVAAFRTYRQALRDVPEQHGFPSAVTWPRVPLTT